MTNTDDDFHIQGMTVVRTHPEGALLIEAMVDANDVLMILGANS